MNSFKKPEKLCSKILIDKLYQEGDSFLIYPLRVTFCLRNDSSEGFVQVLFSATKKRFKKAVHRNILKRRMRESYRLNKNILLTDVRLKGNNLLIAYNYIGNEIVEFEEINDALEKSIVNLILKIDKQAKNTIKE